MCEELARVNTELYEEKVAKLSESLVGAVYQAIGQASMCWERSDCAGVFDAPMASKIAAGLCDTIIEYIEETAKTLAEEISREMRNLL